MNPVFREGAALAEGGLLMGIVTIGFLVFFVGVALRLLRPRARALYAEAALMPLEDDERDPNDDCLRSQPAALGPPSIAGQVRR